MPKVVQIEIDDPKEMIALLKRHEELTKKVLRFKGHWSEDLPLTEDECFQLQGIQMFFFASLSSDVLNSLRASV